jgi:prevent-host-death family protein
VASGESVVLTRHGRPVIKMVSAQPRASPETQPG